MFENGKGLLNVENVLEAIKYFGFNKYPNLDDKILFRCYFEVGINLTEEEKNKFWEILHEVLEHKDIKEKIRKMAKDLFGITTIGDITRARENLDLAEKAIKK